MLKRFFRQIESIYIKKIEGFYVIRPVPFERVNGGFVISGRIPKSWLRSNGGYTDYRVYGTFLDVMGLEFAGSITACIPIGLLGRFKKEFYFSTHAQFAEFNESFVERSQGRVILKLFSQKKDSDIYLPLIINGFEPVIGVNPKIEEAHRDIAKKIIKYKNDLRCYQIELDEILKRRVFDNDILEGIFNILEKSRENFKPFSKCEEDVLIESLEGKYREAIEWDRTFCTGMGATVGRMNGFEFRVYSADHAPKHFHVVHKSRGIEARFSFPGIKLINYKGKSTINRKEVDKIVEFFVNNDNYTKLNNEFQRQIAS